MRQYPRSVLSVTLLRRGLTRKVDLHGRSRYLIEGGSRRSRVRLQQLRGNLPRCRRAMVMSLGHIHIPNRTARLLYLMRRRRIANLHSIHRQHFTTLIPHMHIHPNHNNHIIINNHIHGVGIIDNTLSRQVRVVPKVVLWVGFLHLPPTSRSKLNDMATSSVPMLSIMGDRWKSKPWRMVAGWRSRLGYQGGRLRVRMLVILNRIHAINITTITTTILIIIITNLTRPRM